MVEFKLERAKEQQDLDFRDCREQIDELTSRNSNLSAVIRKLEGEIQVARVGFDFQKNSLALFKKHASEK